MRFIYGSTTTTTGTTKDKERLAIMRRARATLLATLAIFGQQQHQPIEYFNCFAIVVVVDVVVALQLHKARGNGVWAWIAFGLGGHPVRPFLVVKLLAQ